MFVLSNIHRKIVHIGTPINRTMWQKAKEHLITARFFLSRAFPQPPIAEALVDIYESLSITKHIYIEWENEVS